MITRAPRRQRFTIVDNEILGTDLPLESIGLFVYLLSKPDNWAVNVGQLQKRHNCGKNKIYRMLRELRAAGFASYQRNLDGSTDWVIYENNALREAAESGPPRAPVNGYKQPRTQNSDEGAPPALELEGADQGAATGRIKQPRTQKPDMGNSDALIKTDSITKTEKSLSAPTDRVSRADQVTAFDIWYDDIYPRKKDRKRALEVWIRLTAKMTKQQLIDFLTMLSADARARLEADRDWLRGYIPHPKTYLNGERWLDEITTPNQSEQTEEQKYVIQQQRAARALQKIDGTAMGDYVAALPSGMG